MKVIKMPSVDDWSYKFECSGCDAELEAEEKNVFGSTGRYFYVYCMICSEVHYIDEDLIPKLVKHRISKKDNSGSFSDK